MTNIEVFFLYLLLASNAVLVAAACWVLLRFERRWKRLDEYWDDSTNAGTNVAETNDASAERSTTQWLEQAQSNQRLEQRLAELQCAVKAMDKNVPKQGQAMERPPPIDNAVRMAKMGASVEDLTRSCGLNLGEARLLRKLHGNAAPTIN